MGEEENLALRARWRASCSPIVEKKNKATSVHRLVYSSEDEACSLRDSERKNNEEPLS